MRPGHSLRLGGAEIGVVWPLCAPRGLLVVVDGEATRELADRYGVVVLSTSAQDAETVIAWAADHAAELGVSGPLRVADAGDL